MGEGDREAVFRIKKIRRAVCALGRSRHIRTEELFLSQLNGRYIERPDICLCHMACMALMTGDEVVKDGVRLYGKYLASKGEAAEERIGWLTQRATTGVVDVTNGNIIIVDREMQIADTDGIMELATALSRHYEYVNVVRLPVRYSDRCAWDSFERIFSDTEMLAVRNYARSLADRIIDEQTDKYRPGYDKEKLSKAIRRAFGKVYGFDSRKLNFNGRASMHSGGFYQSFPLLGIDGWRKTDERICDYGLQDVLYENMNILNIGCNMGFFDMTIAHSVHSITAIEYNTEASKLSRKIARKIGIYNVRFVGMDFKKWVDVDDSRYDFVMCCSVFPFLRLEPDEFADMIDRLTNDTGTFLYEEANVQEGTKDSVIMTLERKGFGVVKSGITRDYGEEGECTRKWWMLRRSIASQHER